MPFKAESLVPVTSDTTPATGGYFCTQGVQLARWGFSNPLVALGPGYRMPLPEANVVVPGGNLATVVMAFPFNGQGAGSAIPGPPPPPSVSKPYHFRGKR